MGFAWRSTQFLDANAGPGTPADLALLVLRIDDVYEIYWNGRLLAHHGQMPPHPSWFLTVPAQTFGLGHIGQGVLAVRVWKAFFSSRDSGRVGGFAAPLVLGSPLVIDAMKAKIDYAWLREETIVLGIYSLYGLLGLLAFFLWLRDRSQWLLFWTAGLFIPIFLEVVFNNLALPAAGRTSVSADFNLLLSTLSKKHFALVFLDLLYAGAARSPGSADAPHTHCGSHLDDRQRCGCNSLHPFSANALRRSSRRSPMPWSPRSLPCL